MNFNKTKREKIYIVPTKYGWMYLCGVFVTLSAGVIYSNNLVYLLCFFLVTLLLVGMIQTHNNMKNLRLEKIRLNLSSEHSFGSGRVWLKSENPYGNYQIEVESKSQLLWKAPLSRSLLLQTFQFLDFLRKRASSLSPEKRESSRGWGCRIFFKVPRVDKNTLIFQEFSFESFERGRFSFGTLKLSSTFPFGLFWSWKHQTLIGHHYVYPQPLLIGKEGNMSGYSGDFTESQKGSSGDDFTEHRKFQIGDSYRRVDWKSFAKGKGLLVKDFKEGQKETLLLDFWKFHGNFEERLRQLSYWILKCEEKRWIYAVKLPGGFLESGLGGDQKEKCLKALAICKDLKIHDSLVKEAEWKEATGAY